jgi:hypothetical protein
LENAKVSPAASSGHLVAAEAGWLQPNDSNQSDGEFLSEWDGFVPPARFDWRKRSSSRIQFTFSTPENRKRYRRRKFPILQNVQDGELYYNEISNYQKQCVALAFWIFAILVLTACIRQLFAIVGERGSRRR